jgi:hypothetical protein
MAARLEKRVAQAKAAGTPVWIDEAAVLAGAKALREVERLRGSLDRIGIGGNHLASALIHILGAGDDTFPPYKTPPGDAEKIINDPVRMDLWTCWAVMMRERDAVRTDGPTPDPRDTRIAELEAALRVGLNHLGRAFITFETYAAIHKQKGADDKAHNNGLLADEMSAAIAVIDAALKGAQ